MRSRAAAYLMQQQQQLLKAAQQRVERTRQRPRPQHRQLQGEQRPANKVRQRRHARAQHVTCSRNASGLAQQQQQQPGLRSTAAAAKGATELGEAHLGLQRAEGRKASEGGSEQLSEISCNEG